MLLVKQRKQVEEIKKITNFDTTRKLLEQYDAEFPPSVSYEVQVQLTQQTPQRGPIQPSTPSPGHQATPNSPSPDGKQRSAPNSPTTPDAPNAPSIQVQQGPLGTPRAPGHLIGAGGTPAQGREFP